MNKSSLMVLLRVFDKKQLKEFSDFVRSPFFNKNKAVIRLFDYIKTLYPGYDPVKLDKENVYKAAFGKSEYHPIFMRVLMSKLHALAEDYLIHKSLEGDRTGRQNYLIESLSAMNELVLARKIVRNEIKQLETFNPAKADDYLKMYQLMYHKTNLFSQQFSITRMNRPGGNFDNDQKYLICYFLLKILDDYTYYLSLNNIVNYKPKLDFMNGITFFLKENNDYLEIPAIKIQYLNAMLMIEKNIKHLFELKTALYSLYPVMQKQEVYSTISTILNFCHNSYMLTNDEQFLNEKHEINLFALEKNFVTGNEEDTGIGFARYYNILVSFFEVSKFDEAEEFISNYGAKLPEEAQNFWINFSYASLQCYRHDQDSALEYLTKIRRLNNSMEKLNFKGLELKVFYEAGMIEQAETALDAFMHLIQKEKLLSELNKEIFRKYCYYYKKLLLLNFEKKSTNPVSLLKELAKTPNVMQKNWLIKKIKETETK
ncbi:MAG: hypothetical protein ABI543_14260 [Ignavibacteria bacterium]